MVTKMHMTAARIAVAMLLAISVAPETARADSASRESERPTLSRAASITDAPRVKVKAGPKHQSSGCTDSSCAWVRTRTRNFQGVVSCRITKANPGGTVGFIPWAQGPNAVRNGPNYYGFPGGTLRVRCHDAHGHAARGKVTNWGT